MCSVALRCHVLSYVVLCCLILCYVSLCIAMFCVVLCYWLCCDMFCYAVLCCTVLCYAVYVMSGYSLSKQIRFIKSESIKLRIYGDGRKFSVCVCVRVCEYLAACGW